MKNPTGMCLCGCGQLAPLSPTSRRGYKRGDSLMFIKGHSSRRVGPDYVEEEAGFTSPCWMWAKSIGSEGYGRIWNGAGHDMAHRVFYEQHVGPIPEGLQIDHLCRNRACVNPAHLEPVTHAENDRRGIHAKLTRDDARAIRESGERAVVVADRYGVHISVVYDVRNGKTWTEGRVVV